MTRRRHRHRKVFGTCRNDLLRNALDMDSLCLVVVRCWNDLEQVSKLLSNLDRDTYFDDFVSWELEIGNVCGAAGHQVPVEDTQYAFVGNDQKVVLLAFKLQDDGLQAHGEVVVRFGSRVTMVIRISHVLLHFFGILLSNSLF